MPRTRPARRLAVLGGLALAAMILATGAAFASMQEEPTTEEIMQPSGREFLIQVNTVDVQVRESFPVQAAINVDGVIGDGCTRLDRIEQSRSGNTLSVRLIGFHTGDPICTMIAQTYRDNVGLEGTFDPGE